MIPRTCALAAKGLWNLVSRMAQDRPFVNECLKSGVVGGLCGAARGAADLLAALDEVNHGEDISSFMVKFIPPSACSGLCPAMVALLRIVACWVL